MSLKVYKKNLFLIVPLYHPVIRSHDSVQMMRAGVVVPDRRRGLLVFMLGLAVLAPLAAMATVKNVQQQQQQLRVKPQPSSSSGLPVPDLLESPDAKYDPKPKDIDAAALRLRLKGK